jgi:hypothetical protein
VSIASVPSVEVSRSSEKGKVSTHVTPLGQGVPAPAPVVAFDALVVPVEATEPPSPEAVLDADAPPPPSLEEPPVPVGSRPPGGEHAAHVRRSQAEGARA